MVSWGKEELREAVDDCKTFDEVVDLIRLIWGGSVFTKEAVKFHTALKDEAVALLEKAKSGDIRYMERYELLSLMQNLDPDIKYRILGDDEYNDIYDSIKSNSYTKYLLEDVQKYGKEIVSSKSNFVYNKIKSLKETETQLKNEKQKEIEKLRAEIAKKEEEIHEINDKIIAGQSVEENSYEMLRLIEERRDKQNEIYQIGADYRDMVEELDTIGQDIYDEVIDLLNSNSPISEEAAKEWVAENIYLEKKEKNKLDKIGYGYENMLNDIAEFYRLVGGKIGPINFIGTRSRRAYASGKATIAISRYFNKRALFHELGHIVEHFDKNAYYANNAFIKTRATGEPKSLKSLIPFSRYQSNEKAYPDDFIDPYVGKVYTDESTEVLSMGIQNFIDPIRLTNFIKEDRKHFELIMGLCCKKSALVSATIKNAAETIKSKIESEQKNKDDDKKFFKLIDSKITKEFAEEIFTREGYYEIRVMRIERICDYQIKSKYDNDIWETKYVSIGFTIKQQLRMAYLLLVNDSQGFLGKKYDRHGISQIFYQPHNYRWPMDVVRGIEKLPEVSEL